MIRELFISIYLVAFWITFTLCKLFPLQSKTTFVTAFGDNVWYTLEALEKQTNMKIVVIQSNHCRVPLPRASNREVLCYKTYNPIKWIQAVYHIATSDKLFIDTYFAFLSVSSFKPSVQVIQLWHAVGAMKKFGLEDHSIQNRYSIARKRFKEVYKHFNFVVVGSEKMTMIFQRAFGIRENQILRTGIPRTDFFFNEDEKQEAIQKLKDAIPIPMDKKIILYAPTYRDRQLVVRDIALDIPKMYHALKDDYILFLSLHPAVRSHVQIGFKDFVYDVSEYHINHISLVTDILISDYSSIPFEFAILQKPIIFFAYDLKEYESSRGLWDKYEHLVPGPIVKNNEELIDIIIRDDIDMSKIRKFGEDWNQYSNGESSKKLIETLYK